MDLPEIPVIPQWSSSKLKDFQQCRLKAGLKYGLKIPEPERPLPPGKSEHANDRGSRVHLEAENFVNGTGEFGREMEKYRPEFEALRRLYDEGKVSLEGEWAMNRAWEPVPWSSPEAWLRLKIDALIHLSPHEAVVVDYKTGRKFGNEVNHAEQVQLYQLVTFLRYPELEQIHTELWYLDADEITQTSFTRQQGLKFKRAFDQKGNAFTTCLDFQPSPNIYSCRWCPYGPWGTGHCEKGVQK